MVHRMDPQGRETHALTGILDLELDGARVLELGCGDGRLISRYAGRAASVVGVDGKASDLAAADTEGWAREGRRVGLVRADASSLPIRERCFDVALFAWSL